MNSSLEFERCFGIGWCRHGELERLLGGRELALERR
jgi:hypothetical protein